MIRAFGAVFGFLLVGLSSRAGAEAPTRAEVLQIAEAYAGHTWTATAANAMHGRDRDGVEVHTPDSAQSGGDSLWALGANRGIPYKWGGFETIERFDAGIKAGKVAGDVYSPEKRKLGGRAVSNQAVGIDCSGFISRCWKLEQKRSTDSLPEICRVLVSPMELRTGDIMDAEGGHVLLFAKWLDEPKTRGLFYEAAPFSKVLSSERDVAAMMEQGFKPLRYRQIRE